MSQGPGRSEVAERNERKRPGGKGASADHGRNPKRDGEQRGKQKVQEIVTDRMKRKALKTTTLEVPVGRNKPTNRKNANHPLRG